MIYLLFILLLLLLIVAYFFNNKEISSPSIAFIGGFTFSIFFACINAKKYELDLGMNTFFMLFFGALLFFLVSYIVRVRFNKDNRNIEDTSELEPIHIHFVFKIAIIVFSLLFTFLELYFIVKAVGGSMNNFAPAIYTYRNLTAFGNQLIKIPILVELAIGIIHCMAYWLIYILINNYVITKKVDWLLLVACIITSLSNLVEGSRGGIFNILLSSIPIYFIISSKIDYKKLSLKPKYILLFIIIALFVVFNLKNLALLIGRKDTVAIKSDDYIGMYVGAQIKNLDILLQTDYSNDDTAFSHSFNSLVKQLSRLCGFDVIRKENLEIFRSANGHPLGNVYSIYSSFLLDFGYLGFIPMIIIISFSMEYLYEKSKFEKYKNNISLVKLTYAFSYGGIVFCFFGNKLLNQLVNLSFVEYLIMWWILNILLSNIKIHIK